MKTDREEKKRRLLHVLSRLAAGGQLSLRQRCWLPFATKDFVWDDGTEADPVAVAHGGKNGFLDVEPNPFWTSDSGLEWKQRVLATAKGDELLARFPNFPHVPDYRI